MIIEKTGGKTIADHLRYLQKLRLMMYLAPFKFAIFKMTVFTKIA